MAECSVKLAMQSMTETEKNLFLEAVSRKDINKSDIAQCLRNNGHEVSDYMMRYHCRGACSC